MDLKQFEQVLQQSAEALLKYPSQPLIYLINGVALGSLNKPNEAIDVLEEGLDYIIDDSKMEIDFYIQLASAYKAINNLDKAKSFTDKIKLLQNPNE